MRATEVAAAKIAIMLLISSASYSFADYPLKANLRYDLKKGFAFGLTTISNRQHETDYMGNLSVSTVQDTIAYDVRVLKANEKGVLLDFVYIKRAQGIESPQEPAEPDYGALIGQRVGAWLSPGGELFDFAGFDRLPPAPIPGRQDLAGENQYINELRDVFPCLPVGPVDQGEVWTCTRTYEEFVGDGSVTVTLDYAYRVEGERELNGAECYLLKGSYDIGVRGRAATGGLPLVMELTGHGDEIIHLTKEERMLLLRESRSEVMGSAVNEEMGVIIPMVHRTEMVTTVSLE